MFMHSSCCYLRSVVVVPIDGLLGGLNDVIVNMSVFPGKTLNSFSHGGLQNTKTESIVVGAAEVMLIK